MSSAELRSELHEYIDRLDDQFVAVVHSMLDTYIKQQEGDPIVGYDGEGNPIHASVAKEEYKARLEAVDRGEYVTLEELKKQSRTWLKNTK